MMALIEEGIAKAFAVHRLHEAGDREALLRKIGPDIRAICTGSHTGVKTDAAMMAHCPNLKIIGNFGVGYDTIDVAAAAKRGIVITNTPDVLTEEVADTDAGAAARHRARVLRGREMAARRALAQGRRLPPDPASLRDRSSASSASAASARPSRGGSRRSASRSAISGASRRPASTIATTATWSPWRATSTR